MTQQFLLPSSPTIQRQDRFDLIESDEYEVPFWDLLQAILRSESAPVVDISSLIEVLDTIALTLRESNSDTDYRLLQGFLTTYLTEHSSTQFFTKTWPYLVDLALEMPNIFHQDTLPAMSAQDNQGPTEVNFSRKQVACLIVHQFLCSLPPHPWKTESFVDLRPWYSFSSSVHQGAVNAYLTALFTYFERLQQSNENQCSPLDYSVEEWPITFSIRDLTDQTTQSILNNEANEVTLSSTRIETIHLPESHTAPPYLGLPDGACVVSANKCIGYGPSGTQEELQVGTSPEAYPAVLLAPPLSDNQVLICRGAEAMVSIKGYGRDARLDVVLESPSMVEPKGKNSSKWKNRTMIFMDALELDVLPVEGDSLIPDIHPPSRLSRDLICKAYNGFYSNGDPYSHVVTGLWGCRTFGGNRYIKCILQWCAAALARMPVLKFIFAGTEQDAFQQELVQFAAEIAGKSVTVRQVFDILVGLKMHIHAVGKEGIFKYVLEQLNQET